MTARHPERRGGRPAELPQRGPGRSVPFRAGLALALALALPAQADSGYVRKSTAEARPSALMNAAGKPDRIDFLFGNAKAWLMPNGDWRIEGRVTHRGMLCGTYELGLRFGVGNPGCTSVQWLAQPSYASNQSQCNNAVEFHAGGDSQPELQEHYARISCAERLLRCSGNCK